MSGENDIVVAAWNTVLFDKFCRFKHLLIEGLAAHSNAALDRQAFPEGSRVLDVGCGFGDSTRLIAQRVGSRGEAVGVDCAENFVKAAREATREAGIANATAIMAAAIWCLPPRRRSMAPTRACRFAPPTTSTIRSVFMPRRRRPTS
jgi:SAM-dependent methyltransferase